MKPIIPILPTLLPKLGFELVAKKSLQAQTKSLPNIITDVITGRDPSFYSQDTRDGGNEIDTYLYGRPYGAEFTGDESLGADYSNYMKRNYPKAKLKTYNTHFGDTLYIDKSAEKQINDHIINGDVVGGNMGRYALAPSYIVNTTHADKRPYDAGGHLIKFTKNNDQIYAHMTDVWDLLPNNFVEKYNETDLPKWAVSLANAVGTPFKVQQNNIPVVFKQIVPEYKTKLQKELGDFLSQWGDYYDLNIPMNLSDEQIESIFKYSDYGDDMLDYMNKNGWLKVNKQRNGGVLYRKK